MDCWFYFDSRLSQIKEKITHRRTEILTFNPNFDFGAVYTNTMACALPSNNPQYSDFLRGYKFHWRDSDILPRGLRYPSEKLPMESNIYPGYV